MIQQWDVKRIFSIRESIDSLEENWKNKELPPDFFRKMVGFMRTFLLDSRHEKEISLIDLLVAVKMVESKREAKELIKNNAVSLNNRKINDAGKMITLEDFVNNQFLMVGAGRDGRCIVVQQGIVREERWLMKLRDIAQLGLERLSGGQEAAGSNPVIPTKNV